MLFNPIILYGAVSNTNFTELNKSENIITEIYNIKIWNFSKITDNVNKRDAILENKIDIDVKSYIKKINTFSFSNNSCKGYREIIKSNCNYWNR